MPVRGSGRGSSLGGGVRCRGAIGGRWGAAAVRHRGTPNFESASPVLAGPDIEVSPECPTRAGAVRLDLSVAPSLPSLERRGGSARRDPLLAGGGLDDSAWSPPLCRSGSCSSGQGCQAHIEPLGGGGADRASRVALPMVEDDRSVGPCGLVLPRREGFPPRPRQRPVSGG